MKDIEEHKVFTVNLKYGYFHIEIRQDITRLIISDSEDRVSILDQDIDKLREFLNHIKAKQQ